MEDPKLTSLSEEQQAQVTGGSVPGRQSCPACGGKGYIITGSAGETFKRKPCAMCCGIGNIAAIAGLPQEDSLF